MDNSQNFQKIDNIIINLYIFLTEIWVIAMQLKIKINQLSKMKKKEYNWKKSLNLLNN